MPSAAVVVRVLGAIPLWRSPSLEVPVPPQSSTSRDKPRSVVTSRVPGSTSATAGPESPQAEEATTSTTPTDPTTTPPG